MHGYFRSWHIASLRCDATISLLSATSWTRAISPIGTCMSSRPRGRFRFDRIETELWILGLMQFLDANRYPPRIKSGQAFAGKTPWADSTAGAWEFYPRSR